MNNNKPLVSVIIATYNSENTVIETLESIKNQDYTNIELVITDDASRDNTLQVCEKWLALNEYRFVRTQLVSNNTNTGVSANMNRGISVARGEWIKSLGADDIIFPNGITAFVKCALQHSDYYFFVGKVLLYADEFKDECIIHDDCQDKAASYYSLPLLDQLKIIATNNYVMAPGLFYNKDVCVSLGGFESNSIIEDYPFHIKAMEHGYKYYYIDIPLIGYRKTSGSTTGNSGRLFNYRFVKCRFENYRDFGFKYMDKKSRNREVFRYKRYSFFEFMGLNHNNMFCRFLYKASGKFQDWLFGKK